jgi:hypothetical protein
MKDTRHVRWNPRMHQGTVMATLAGLMEASPCAPTDGNPVKSI